MELDDESILSEHSKEAAKGSFWALVGSISVKFISFFYVVFLARMASQEDVGLFYLALSILLVISVISDAGISGSLKRYVPYFEGKNEKGKIRDLLRFGYTLPPVLGLILLVLLWWQADTIGAIYNNAKLPELVRILSVYIVLTNVYTVNNAYLNGRADVKSTQKVQLTQAIAELVLTVAFFMVFGASAVAIAAAFILSYLPALLFSFYLVHKRSQDLPKQGTGIPVSELTNELIPFGIMLASLVYVNTIFSSSGRLLLGYFDSPATVAIYSVAVTIASALAIFPSSVGTIFLPVLARLVGKGDQEGMHHLLETVQRWVLFITLPFCVVFFVFSAELLHLFYGTSYASGGLAMSIFVFGLVLSYFSYPVSLTLAAMRMVKLELGIMVVGAMLNVLLCLFLIPPYGMEGAAAASAISFLIISILLFYYAAKLVGYKISGAVYKLASVALLTGILILAIKIFVFQGVRESVLSSLVDYSSYSQQPYLSKFISLMFVGSLVVATGFIFFPCALLLKCFQPEDVILMRKVLRKAFVPPTLVSLAERLARYGVAK